MTLRSSFATAAAVLTEAGSWSVDQHDDYDGNVMIVAVHDETDQTFALSETVGGIELAELREDRMTCCGTFAGIEGALAALLRTASRERA